MLLLIDRKLNAITMYRVVLYGLGALALIAVALAFGGIVTYGGLQLIESLAILCAVCVAVNAACAYALRVPANKESMLITALILFFLLAPPQSAQDMLWIAGGGAIAMLSKYLLAYRGKHLFNPAALAAFVLGFTPFGGAIWWVGTPWLFAPAAIVAIMIVRKTRRIAVFTASVAASIVTLLAYTVWSSDAVTAAALGSALGQHLLSWPILFFASVMVTEPPRRHPPGSADSPPGP